MKTENNEIKANRIQTCLEEISVIEKQYLIELDTLNKKLSKYKRSKKINSDFVIIRQMKTDLLYEMCVKINKTAAVHGLNHDFVNKIANIKRLTRNEKIK
jgi:hypothetical protein